MTTTGIHGYLSWSTDQLNNLRKTEFCVYTNDVGEADAEQGRLIGGCGYVCGVFFVLVKDCPPCLPCRRQASSALRAPPPKEDRVFVFGMLLCLRGVDCLGGRRSLKRGEGRAGQGMGRSGSDRQPGAVLAFAQQRQ